MVRAVDKADAITLTLYNIGSHLPFFTTIAFQIFITKPTENYRLKRGTSHMRSVYESDTLLTL